MSDLKLGAVESRFAEIIWQNEPIASGKLVKLCEKELNWKKPTTYTVLRKLCKKGIFQNENGTVTSKIKKDEFNAMQSEQFIDEAFDKVEAKYGHSAIIDVLRKYYHSDWYFDADGNLQKSYQSLKQGCSVASWLANVVMFSLDERLSKLDGEYVRYSDDALFVGPDYMRAMEIMSEEVAMREMTLNPKKIEYLTHTRWFKFLGFSIMGASISLSSTRIKSFQKEIEARTIRAKNLSFNKAINQVNNYLYFGNGEYSWATQVLPVINVQKDVQILSVFVADCLRAVITGKTKVGGLGYVANNPDGCIQRGIGRNVKANRIKTDKTLPGYYTLGCMQNALRTSKEVYKTLVANLNRK